MDSFLFSMIPRVLRLSADNVPWHYNSVCEHCTWRNPCRQRTEIEGTVSMIPDLNIEDAGFLREVIRLRPKGDMTDIEELDTLVNGGLRVVEQTYPSTATRFRKLMGLKRREIGSSPVIEAVKTKKPQVMTSLMLLIVASWKTYISLSSKRRLCGYNIIGFGSSFRIAPPHFVGFRYNRIPQRTTRQRIDVLRQG